MASNKSYAYYVKGNKIALVQRNSTDSNATGESYHEFKSPTEAVTDGIEIEYTRVPWFEYDRKDNLVALSLTKFLSFQNVVDKKHLSYKNADANVASAFVVGDYVYLTGVGKYAGLHKIKSSTYTSFTEVIFETRVYDTTVASVTSGTIYTTVSALEDETSEIQMASFLIKAAVYYVKAKLAEDSGQLDLKEYFMKEYRKILSRHEDSRITGMRKVASFGMSR